MSLLKAFFPKVAQLTPRGGGRPGTLSVAYRKGSLFVTIGKATSEAMGFIPAKTWAEVGHDREAGSLVVIPRPNGANEPDSNRLWRVGYRDGTHVFGFLFSGGKVDRAAEPVEHELKKFDLPALMPRQAPDSTPLKIVGQPPVTVLVVKLPDWAAPERRGRVLAAEAADHARQGMAHLGGR